MKSTFPDMAKVIPAGKVGEAEVDHYTVDKFQSQMSALRRGEFCYEGTYARLRVRGTTVMSDTRMERTTNLTVVSEARGDVLIAGFGIGMILIPILLKPDVRRVTVVERSADVVTLVRPHIDAYIGSAARKLHVIISDIHKWRPEAKGRSFDVIYFDIWPDICTDNLDEMKRLRKAFAPFLRVGGWAACWQQENLRSRRREGMHA